MDRKNTPPPPTSPFNTVFFDWDGCLADSLEVWIRVIQEGLEEYGITGIPRKDVIRYTMVKFDNVDKLGIENPREFGTAINRKFAERIEEITLSPFARETLEELRMQGKKIVLITTSGRLAINRCIETFSLQNYFDATITYDDVERHKPDPEGILKGLTATSSLPENAIIVGDTRNDILAGKAAGIRTVMYFPESHEDIYEKDHLLALNADYYLRNLRELLRIVR
ncbi:MAG: HAD-IA family hydrolase [Patescibacteria group bacterium]|nr:HAD-IA family hydrolase [Patescibacteria group bacterium]